MAADTETASALPDSLKWTFSVLLFLGGLAGFYFYADHSLLLRVVAILVIGGVALFVASTTSSGRLAMGFVRDARTEVRKVVWPTRKETIQTTMIVLGAVCVVALFLWGVDAILAVATRALLGNGA